MNVFNRTFLGLYSLLWFGACVGLIAMAWNTGQMLDINIGNFSLQAFILSDSTDRWVFSIVVGLLGSVGLITFFSAFRQAGVSGSKSIRARRPDGTIVDVDSEVVEGMLRDELEALPHIRQANPLVRSNGGVVDSQISVSIDAGARIADVTAAVNEATGAVLKHRIGAQQVRRPVIHITYDEVAARPSSGAPRHVEPAEGPLPPPPPPPPERAISYAADANPVPPPPDEGILPPPPQRARTETLLWDAPSERQSEDGGGAHKEWSPEGAEHDPSLPPPPPPPGENDDTTIIGEDHRA